MRDRVEQRRLQAEQEDQRRIPTDGDGQPQREETKNKNKNMNPRVSRFDAEVTQTRTPTLIPTLTLAPIEDDNRADSALPKRHRGEE